VWLQRRVHKVLLTCERMLESERLEVGMVGPPDRPVVTYAGWGHTSHTAVMIDWYSVAVCRS
jgi:hypothetical protein